MVVFFVLLLTIPRYIMRLAANGALIVMLSMRMQHSQSHANRVEMRFQRDGGAHLVSLKRACLVTAMAGAFLLDLSWI
jgi:hypothetical protein